MRQTNNVCVGNAARQPVLIGMCLLLPLTFVPRFYRPWRIATLHCRCIPPSATAFASPPADTPPDTTASRPSTHGTVQPISHEIQRICAIWQRCLVNVATPRKHFQMSPARASEAGQLICGWLGKRRVFARPGPAEWRDSGGRGLSEWGFPAPRTLGLAQQLQASEAGQPEKQRGTYKCDTEIPGSVTEAQHC